MTPKVPDYGHRGADKELMALIRRLHLSYLQARISLQEKIEKYLDEFEKQDAEKRALYDSGELSHEDYMKWKYSTLAGTKQWKRMLNQLADDMTKQNEIAASMINDTLPEVYALNHNFGTYEAEKGSGYDTTYTMYDKFTVKRLLTEHEDMLPKPSVPIEKDKLWNRQHLQSAMLQGILTGESMSDIAKRFQYCTNMTENAAIRNARTAVTGAENAGRIDSYIRAEKMGIKMKQMWMATLDARTRDSHAIMDGEQQEVGKKFSNGCRYPGDPHGAPGEIWNCRCTLVAIVEGADPYNPNLRKSSYLEDEGLTYEEWKRMHGEQFYSKLFEDYKETKRELSFAEQIANNQNEKLYPEEIFGFIKGHGDRYSAWWMNEFGEDEDIQNWQSNTIEQTVARLQQKYPMQAKNHDKNDVTSQKIILTDYRLVPTYLPDGEDDRRYNDDWVVLGQVFNLEKDGIETSVIGFHRISLSGDPDGFTKAIKRRSNAIENNIILDSLSDSSVEGVTIHEWGHIFINQHMDNAFVHGSEAADEYWKWYKTLTKDEIKQGISDYASTNRGEFEAECFLELQMPNPRPLAVKMWSFMERILKEGY